MKSVILTNHYFHFQVAARELDICAYMDKNFLTASIPVHRVTIHVSRWVEIIQFLLLMRKKMYFMRYRLILTGRSRSIKIDPGRSLSISVNLFFVK